MTDSLLEGAHHQLVTTIGQRMIRTSGYLDQGEDFIVYDMGNPEADTHLRGATVGAYAKGEEVLASMARFQNDSRPEWSIRVHPLARNRVEDAFAAAGYFLGEPEGYPIMAIGEPIVRTAVHRTELVEQNKEGEALVLEASPVLEQCFSLSQKTSLRLLGAGAWTTDPHWRAAVSWCDNEVACFGMLTHEAGSDYAGIYYIATLESYRGRGLAKDLVTKLTNQGFELGAKHVILQASRLGVPVYRRLGYEEIGRYFSFTRGAEDS